MRSRTPSPRTLLTSTALGLTLALGLTGCWGGAEESAETRTPTPSTSTSDTASASTSPTDSPTAASSSTTASSPAAAPTSGGRETSAGATRQPTQTPEAPVSPSPTDGEPTIGHQASPVHVYWILEGDDGAQGEQIGCGDSLVMSSVPGMDPALTGAERVEAGIQALLSQRDHAVGERNLTNALYASELTLESAEIDGDTVTVRLTGQPLSAGTCDDPRIIEQLEHTALVNSGVSTARVLIDGTPIQEFMSPRG